MDKEKLQYFKELLLKKKEAILRDVKATTKELTEGSEPLPDAIDQALKESNVSFELRLRDREQKLLKKIEKALKKIENGTYGICIECIDEPKHLCPTCPLIPKERLLAVPHTQHCLPVKQMMQKKK